MIKAQCKEVAQLTPPFTCYQRAFYACWEKENTAVRYTCERHRFGVTVPLAAIVRTA